MENPIEALPQLAAYHTTFIALTVLCLIVLIQSFLAGILGLAGGEETAGMPLKGDHSKFSFRTLRTYANSTENFSVMVATVLLAIIAGVSPVIVNWLVALHVFFRLVFWAVYYSGIGKVNGGTRTIVYVAGFLMNVLLAAITTYTILL